MLNLLYQQNGAGAGSKILGVTSAHPSVAISIRDNHARGTSARASSVPAEVLASFEAPQPAATVLGGAASAATDEVCSHAACFIRAKVRAEVNVQVEVATVICCVRGGALRRHGRGAVASCRCQQCCCCCQQCCHHCTPSLQTVFSAALLMPLLSHAFPAPITSTRVFRGASRGGDGAAMLAAEVLASIEAPHKAATVLPCSRRCSPPSAKARAATHAAHHVRCTRGEGGVGCEFDMGRGTIPGFPCSLSPPASLPSPSPSPSLSSPQRARCWR
ncbi:unnamed protein product [Closterium sp. Naga37s-1]|nr:unnamed protein product [Closterium sp. Naga37s-1]